eukprot:evm.model.scf_36.1 EVM.evm.TU.scf_36.1   scf_36:867-4320(-)
MPLSQTDGRLQGALIAAAAAVLALATYKLCRCWHAAKCKAIADGVLGAIGGTPLIRIKSLSEATGCEILAKAEFLNPGGSVKDRVARQMVLEALKSGQLRPGGLITEGTVGSTGVSLAMVARAVGCSCRIAMPDDAAVEKVQMLEALGEHKLLLARTCP